MINEKNDIMEDIRLSLKSLRKILAREVKTLNKREEELKEADTHDIYSQWADTILAQRDLVKKGDLKLDTTNIHTGEEVSIPLNPKCSVDKNAELLYKKARKGRRGVEVCEEQCAQSKLLIEEISSKIAEAENYLEKGVAGSEGEGERVLQNLKEVLPETAEPKSKKRVEASCPYRHYRYKGWDIYAGKSASQNDELSTRFAKPSDLWFHAAGYAGSHVIIRCPKNAPRPTPDIVAVAGGIAVFFSKAKFSSYAEVHITEARFVRKPRHSPVGQVVAERCVVKRVSPVDPQTLFK